MIYELENRIQPYAWGSHTLLPQLLGHSKPSLEPWAELWMGAHPRAPSLVKGLGQDLPLDRFLEKDPGALLGKELTHRFGPSLPFLFKVLAIESPLSIQCHPGEERAREGFQEENRRGIPLDAPERNYRDPHHKPEIILALSDFTALRGLRRIEETAAFFSALPEPDLRAAGNALARASDPAEGLRAFLEKILKAPRKTAASWIRSCMQGPLPGEASPGRPQTDPGLSSPEGSGNDSGTVGKAGLEASWFRRLAARYPEDAGCFAPFYLNLVQLQPGEALALAAGELHAYLEGLGVELMANSDNVLRGGLTPKHRDVDELLRILDYRTTRGEILGPKRELRDGGFYEDQYPSSAEEFCLSVLRGEAGPAGALPQTQLNSPGPEILFCGAGEGRIQGLENSLHLHRGMAVFVPAQENRYLVSGACTLYRARVPL